MVTYYSVNERGGRPDQEDTVGVCILENTAFFAVADGLGGHGKGDVASSAIIQYALERFGEESEPENYFQDIFVNGNNYLTALQDQARLPESMKTTLVCGMITGNYITGAHIGDSRFYVFENGQLIYRSKDHSVPQILALSGEIQESQIRNHPDRNKVLRVLGSREEEPRYEKHGPWEARQGISLLLCTDGFWEYVKEEEMQKTHGKSGNVEAWMRKMKGIVRRRGILKRQDNFSAIGVWIR